MNVDRKLVVKLSMDGLATLTVGLPFLLLFFFGEPFHRGFFCDDDSIRYPYRDSTVPSAALFIVSIGFSVFTIVVGEYFRLKTMLPVPGWRPVKLYFWILYHQLIVFAFGALASQSLTDIAKYSLGRLRPHFIAVCAANVLAICDSNVHNYISDYACDDNPRVKDARLSFMSGHSSFAAYCAVFLVLYLHSRIKDQKLLLPRSLLQVFLIYLAIWTGFTRISDYKHHWSDVLIGLLQGSSVAILTVRYVADLFQLTTWGSTLKITDDEKRGEVAGDHERNYSSIPL